ncbi:MAG: hypothetical protein A2Y17_13260 [Clostridiales bacterium GWF2_38_85]|nr:MAG: hypothetical protein A2Y17_13260 [Clostridiales bacterium GWF2_38_85]
MILVPLLSSILLIVAVVLLLGLTPERITNDIMKVISPKQSLRHRVKIAQGKKKSRKIAELLNHINEAMIATGKGTQFAMICSASLALMICGGVFAIMINNVFLLPILAIAFAILPFVYAKTTISYYDKHIEEEIEVTLSLITTAYCRSNDIVLAVRENIHNIRLPVNIIFKSFLGETTAISSNIKNSLHKLKGKVNNDIFGEWVDTLIACQDDRKLNDTLQPVVTKLSDVRIVNNELKTMLGETKKEYYMMVAMVVGNIPLLYMLNKSWYAALMFSIPGKIALAVCGMVILVTALLMMKYTKPIEYRR